MSSTDKGDEGPRPRAALDGIGRYRPGKAAETAMREHDLAEAIKLASNELPYGPLPAAERAVIEAMHHGNRYADHLAVGLRAALAGRHGLDVDQVAVGCGSVGLLQQLFLAYVDPGDDVVYGWRTFETYPIYARLVAANSITVPLRRQALDVTALTEAVTERTRLLLVTSPNNPTGTALGRAALEYLLANVPSHVLVVLDEAYREFVTRRDRPDAVGLVGRHPNFVVLRTFSKAYGLAALRVGYAFGTPDVVDALTKTLVPFTVNGLGQAAALASLDADGELRVRLDHVLAERGRVERALRRAGFSVPDPQANFVWLPAGVGAEALALALERRGVVTRPFAGEGVRVTIGSAEENDRFLDAFASLDVDPGSWTLPTGDRAEEVAGLLDRVDALTDGHAAAPSLAALVGGAVRYEDAPVAEVAAVVRDAVAGCGADEWVEVAPVADEVVHALERA